MEERAAMIPLAYLVRDLAILGGRFALAGLERRDPDVVEEIDHWLATAREIVEHRGAEPQLRDRLREQIHEMTKAQAEIMRRRARGGGE